MRLAGMNAYDRVTPLLGDVFFFMQPTPRLSVRISIILVLFFVARGSWPFWNLTNPVPPLTPRCFVIDGWLLRVSQSCCCSWYDVNARFWYWLFWTRSLISDWTNANVKKEKNSRNGSIKTNDKTAKKNGGKLTIKRRETYKKTAVLRRLPWSRGTIAKGRSVPVQNPGVVESVGSCGQDDIWLGWVPFSYFYPEIAVCSGAVGPVWVCLFYGPADASLVPRAGNKFPVRLQSDKVKFFHAFWQVRNADV